MEQRKRWMFGVVTLSTTTVLALAFDAAWSRVAIGLLLVIAAFCVMQARAQTCVLLAYTGRRNLDAGPERIHDLGERREAVRIANMVSAKALALAFACVALLALL